jgi:hypothetical protein
MSEEDFVVGEGPSFERELPKRGSCACRVWKSFNVGLQSFKGSAPSPKVVIYFITPYRYSQGDFKGKRMLVRQMYTAGLGKENSKKKTWLREAVEAIIGRDVEEADKKKGFNALIGGRSCLVEIIHENGYANIKTVMSMPEGMPALSSDPDSDPADDYLPDYVKNMREKAVVQEHPDTDKIAEKGWVAGDKKEGRPPTKEEIDIF